MRGRLSIPARSRRPSDAPCVRVCRLICHRSLDARCCRADIHDALRHVRAGHAVRVCACKICVDGCTFRDGDDAAHAAGRLAARQARRVVEGAGRVSPWANSRRVCAGNMPV